MCSVRFITGYLSAAGRGGIQIPQLSIPFTSNTAEHHLNTKYPLYRLLQLTGSRGFGTFRLQTGASPVTAYLVSIDEQPVGIQMNDNKLRCKDCMFCSSQNSEQQAGLCTEEHSPKNASGIPMKTVPLWAYACRYGKTLPLPAKRVQRRTRR